MSMFSLGLVGLTFTDKVLCYVLLTDILLCFCKILIRLSSHTGIFITQEYYVKNKLRVWARRGHHEALHNMLPSKLALLFYM
jgi:hypothetical protein